MIYKKSNVYNLKLEFFNTLLLWSQKEESLVILKEKFLLLIRHMKVSMKDLETAAMIKRESRGGFTQNVLLKYVLIHEKESLLIEKFFMSFNNVFMGKVGENNNIYYKFFCEKAVRDKVLCKSDVIIHNKEIVNNETFILLLKNKLFEECKEMLSAKTAMEFLEEAGDFYEILEELMRRNREKQ